MNEEKELKMCPVSKVDLAVMVTKAVFLGGATIFSFVDSMTAEEWREYSVKIKPSLKEASELLEKTEMLLTGIN